VISRKPSKLESMTQSGREAPSFAARLPMATLAAILLASTALSGVARAQTPPQPTAPLNPTATHRIERIIVKGNERIEQGTILSYLPIQPHTTVTEEQLGEAYTALFQSGLFADIRRLEVSGTDLTVEVVENPIINRVLFEGEKALKEDKLRDEISVRPRGVFTRNRVQQDVQRIIELYRRSGRISATVTPKIVELPQKRIDLIFEIDEGPKSGVLDVNFIGNKQYSDNDLRDVIVTERSVFYKFFASNDNYDPDRIEYDEQKLRDYYRNHGYYDFTVLSSVAELKPERNAFLINYTIDEGRQYHFGKVTVKTELKRLDGAVLQRLLPIAAGDIFSDDKIKAATDALTYAAGVVGFAFVDIRPDYTPNPVTGQIDVVFNVSEGPRVYVERVDIVGNTQTLDKVIRREMRLAEGDAYNRQLKEASTDAIRRLNFFQDVSIEEESGSAPDKTDLRVKVQEKATGQLAFSAGYSSIDKLVVDASVEQSNFRGRGQSVRAIVSVGSLRQQIDLSFTEPRWRGRNNAAGFDLYSYRYDYSQQAGYTSNTTGLQLFTAFPLSTNSQFRTNYTIRTDNINIPTLTCSGSNLPSTCSQVGTKITSSVGYTWTFDSRNDSRNPTRGYTLAFSQEFAGLGGDINYVKSELTGSWYHAFTKNYVFSAVGAVGDITGYGGDSVRINDRFFKGGQTFRGFQIAGIGPRDTSTNTAFGGKVYGIGTLELTVPTFWPEQYGIQASLFTDFGTLGQVDHADRLTCTSGTPPVCNVNSALKDDLGLRASAGVSIAWKSPLGPIQLDFSRILKKDLYDRPETFRFSTSTKF
jgi:outer membrane protein insertion porin family